MRFIEGEQSIALTHESSEARLPNFLCLSPQKETRLIWFDSECKAYDLDGSEAADWQKALESRPLDDEEVDQLLEEFRLTPIFVSGNIADHVRAEQLNITTLVPSQIRYFDRLVGR